MALDLAQLHATLKDATRQAFADLRRQHPQERLYAFALYTNDVGQYIVPSANTEEGLARHAAQAARRDGIADELHRASLRWSPCDWAYHADASLVPFFAGVERLLSDGPDPYDLDDEACAQQVGGVFETCLTVLAELDAEGVFGRGQARAALVINLLMGDQSDAERLERARRLNPPATYAHFAQELEDGHRAFARRSAPRRTAGSAGGGSG